MENNSVVGIDISKDQLDIHVLPSQDSFCVPRGATGLEGLVERLLVLKPKLVVMEATGGFETIVASPLAAAGVPLAVVNPRRVRAVAPYAVQFAKTDRLHE